MNVLLMLLMLSRPAAAQAGGNCKEMGYEDALKCVKDQIKDLVKQADDANKQNQRALAKLRSLGQKAQSAAQTLMDGQNKGENIETPEDPQATMNCNAQDQDKNTALNSAQGFQGDASDAGNAHDQAHETLERIPGKFQEVDQTLRQIKSDIDDALGRLHGSPATRLAADQLMAVRTSATTEHSSEEKAALGLKQDYQKTQKRWDRFKQDIQSGRIKRFDQKVAQMVQEGSSFASRAPGEVSSAMRCHGSSFANGSQDMTQEPSKLSQDAGEQPAESAVNDARGQ